MSNGRFNPPPGWPDPPTGWVPPANWAPDPSWPPAPPDWQFWIPADDEPFAANGASPTEPAPPPRANGHHKRAGTGRHAAPATGSALAAPAPLVATGRHAAPPGTNPVITTVLPLPRPGPSRPARQPLEAPGRDARAERISELERRIRALEQEEAELENLLSELTGSLAVQDAGLHSYHHPLQSAELYQPLLAELQARMTELIRLGRAVLASSSFSYENSHARGQKIASDLARLMLRAYNAEADTTLRSLRAGEVASAVQRLENAARTIARLGAPLELRIAQEYHELRLEEIRLTADYLMKTEEQQEEARRERARLREEERAQQRFGQERARLDRERKRVLDALPAAAARGEETDLRERLAQLDAEIERNERQAADRRAGYVYVASNLGAFGADVVKIGMTRMPDPLATVRELGDESLPFPFDVHFYCFADDAVTLVRELHEHFAARTVNHADPRGGFFVAAPQEVRDVLSAGYDVEIVDVPEATRYHQSRGRWPVDRRG